MSEGWQDEALCLGVDPVQMQPDHATRAEVDEAKGWCWSCPVFDQCQAAAEDQFPAVYGVWAGRWWGDEPAWEVERVCAFEGCGVTFRTPESGRKSASFCSARCRGASHRANKMLA